MTTVQSPAVHAAAVGTLSNEDAGTLRRSLFALAGYGTAGLAGFLLSVVVGRGLGADGAGGFFVAVAAATIGMYVLTFGADTGLMRSLARARALDRLEVVEPTLKVGLLPAALASCLFGILLIVTAPLLAHELTPHVSSGAVWLWRGVGLSLPASVVAFVLLHGALRGLGSMRPLILLWQIALPLARVLLAVVFALGVASLSGAVLSWALLPVPVAVVAVVLARRQVRRTVPAELIGRAPALPWKPFWSFASARGAASCFEICIIWLDVILMTVLRGPHDAGIYAAASRFITTGTLALQATRIAIGPQMAAALAHDDRARANRLYSTSTVLVVLLSWPIFLSLAIFGSSVLTVFGSGFQSGGAALRVIGVAMLFYAAVGNVTTVLVMGGKSRWTAMNVGAALVTNIVLNLILIPAYGSVGAAIAWACSIVVDTGLSAFQVARYLGVHGHGRPFLLAAGLAAAIFGVGGVTARLLLPTGLAAVVPALAGLTIVYAACILLFRRRLLPGEGAGAFAFA